MSSEKKCHCFIRKGPQLLGMTLDFHEAGKVIVHMSDYVKNMLNDAPKDMNGRASTPASAHLFKVSNKDLTLLPVDKKEIFMHLVMQGIYLSQRG